MKKRIAAFFSFALLTWAAVILLSFAGRAHSGEPSSPELLQLGEELFNTKEKLGVKFACILCHKQEKAIKKSDVAKLGDRLPDAINDHIVKKSKGKPLPKDSENMKALVAYIRHRHSV